MEARYRESGERAWIRSLRIVWDAWALFWTPDARLRRLCLGHRLLESGRLESARQAFAEVARRWPYEAEAVFGLGCVQHRLGQNEPAARLLARAAELARARWSRIPEEREALKAEARSQWESMRQAQAGVESALGHRRAALGLRLGDAQAAMREYEALTAAADAPAVALNNLAWLYCTHSGDAERWRRARVLAERARALEPWSDEVLGTLGAACQRSGDPAAAVEILAPLVARRPELAQSRDFLAQAQADLVRAPEPGR